MLDDATITGTGQSSAEVLGLTSGVLAESLPRHLVREIMVRGSCGGPLAPLADQLNHDVTHLQGQRLEGTLAWVADQVTALTRADRATATSAKPVRLLPRPTFLVGREELLAELDARLISGDDLWPQIVALSGLGGAGKTSVAVEYAHRHLGEVGVAWQLSAEDATVLAAGFTDLAARSARRSSGRWGSGGSGALRARLYPARWLLVSITYPARSSCGVSATSREWLGPDHQPQRAVAPQPGGRGAGPGP